MELGKEVTIGLVAAGNDSPGKAFFMVDPAKRLGGVGIAQPDLARANFLGTENVLRRRQLGEPELGRRRAEEIELARGIVDTVLVPT